MHENLLMSFNINIPLKVIANFSEKGIKQIHLEKASKGISICYGSSTAILEEWKYWLIQYAEKNFILSNFPMDLSGVTEFRKKILGELCRVLPGTTSYYREIATQVGNEKSSRAVGTACGKNPLPLLIPCHRILRKDATLGGFAFGLPMKQFLLEHENWHKSRIIGD